MVVHASNLMLRVQKDDFETLKKLPKLTHGLISYNHCAIVGSEEITAIFKV